MKFVIRDQRISLQKIGIAPYILFDNNNFPVLSIVSDGVFLETNINNKALLYNNFNNYFYVKNFSDRKIVLSILQNNINTLNYNIILYPNSVNGETTIKFDCDPTELSAAKPVPTKLSEAKPVPTVNHHIKFIVYNIENCTWKILSDFIASPKFINVPSKTDTSIKDTVVDDTEIHTDIDYNKNVQLSFVCVNVPYLHHIPYIPNYHKLSVSNQIIETDKCVKCLNKFTNFKEQFRRDIKCENTRLVPSTTLGVPSTTLGVPSTTLGVPASLSTTSLDPTKLSTAKQDPAKPVPYVIEYKPSLNTVKPIIYLPCEHQLFCTLCYEKLSKPGSYLVNVCIICNSRIVSYI